MSKVKDIDYAFSVSRIHAVERSLLDRNKIMQIAEAKSASDALRMIYDSGYLQNDDYEKSFEASLNAAYDLVYSMAPDRSILETFLIENDFYNLKVLLKSDFLKKDLDYLLNKRCKSGIGKIKEAVAERKGDMISENFAAALNDSLASFAANRNAQLVDMIVDKYAYAEILSHAEQTDTPFVTELVKMKIDLINIKTMFRLRKMGKNQAFAEKAYLDGGNVGSKALDSGLTEPKDAVISAFAGTKYFALITANADGLDGNSDAISSLETACDDMVIDYIRKAKQISFGVEPLVAYILAKENEVKQLRIIMVAKAADMDSESIKRRLNASYV